MEDLYRYTILCARRNAPWLRSSTNRRKGCNQCPGRAGIVFLPDPRCHNVFPGGRYVLAVDQTRPDPTATASVLKNAESRTDTASQTSRHLRASPRPDGLEQQEYLLRHLRQPDPIRERRHKARLPTQRRRTHRRRQPSPPTPLQHTHDNLKPLLPAHRPDDNRRRGLARRQAGPTRPVEALPAEMVLHAGGLHRAGRVDRGRCAARGVGGSGRDAFASRHSLVAALAVPG